MPQGGDYLKKSRSGHRMSRTVVTDDIYCGSTGGMMVILCLSERSLFLGNTQTFLYQKVSDLCVYLLNGELYEKMGRMQYKICVSGSAATDHPEEILNLARALGAAIARAGHVVLTGATTGIPHEAARGAKEAGGISIGFSPALSQSEHVRKYRLPTSHMDLIVYTGFGYSGRNLFVVRASEAVIFLSGRIGTLNEFTNAFEDRKPIGVLLDTGGTSQLIDEIVDVAKRGQGLIVYDDNPEKLLVKVLELIQSEKRVRLKR